MNLNYVVDSENHKITFCKEINDSVVDQIEILNSDKNILILIDKNIDKVIVEKLKSILKIRGYNIYFFDVSGSKKNKNINFLIKILEFLLAKKFTKSSIILSIGGGVVGDLSALASSLYYRGLNYLHVPTTMTAIIDSSIGGKTAINHKNFINAIGSYYHPKNVFIFYDIIKKLPEREYIAGIPEIMKCGLLKDESILKILNDDYKKVLSRDYKTLVKLCIKTLKCKIFFFKDDVRENYKRLFLNFGHTFGHSIEISTDLKNKDFFRHGEAVGLGILCELYYAGKNNKLFLETIKLLRKYNLPTTIDQKKFNKALEKNIYQNLYKDKKRISKHPRYIKLKRIGGYKISELDDHEKILETIDIILS